MFAGEARNLTAELERVAAGEAFLLQAGDCAESFDSFSADSIRDKLKMILQMAVVLTYSSGVPAAQGGPHRRASSRSRDRRRSRSVDGAELPAFRGHMVNDIAFTPAARTPDPERLLAAYHQSSARRSTCSGRSPRAASPTCHGSTSGTRTSSPAAGKGQRYEQLAAEIDRAMRFMKACGFATESEPKLHEVDFFTSHEALILGYEEALTRRDSLTGDWYDCSAHLLWIGDRTHQLDGAHVDFVRGIGNPVGVKIGPTCPPSDVVDLCEALNPDQRPGRLTLVTRLGAARIRERCRRCCRRSSVPGTRSCGAATRCTATPSHPTRAARPGTST